MTRKAATAGRKTAPATANARVTETVDLRCERPGRRAAGLLLAVLLGMAGATVEEPTLRVGTSGDYAPFSLDPDGPAPLDGLDVALARAYAADRGLRLDLIRFTWPELERRLAAGDFDVAMSGVTVRPERSVLGRFTTPVAESGAVVLVHEGPSPPSLAELDGPGVTLAVNAGGHLERAARARFPRATVRALADNAAVLGELASGRAGGAVTDTLEAPAWQARLPGLVAIGPFTRDRKAWLVSPGAEDLAADLDAYLAAKEADGTLASLRERWLAPGARSETATPLGALVAALDERLALMPLVAEAKRKVGRPVRDTAQEARVLEAAAADVARAAATAGRPPPSRECVTELFRAQIDAASAIQEAVLAGPASTAALPSDLEGALRPALARIGARVAAALIALQEAPPASPPQAPATGAQQAPSAQSSLASASREQRGGKALAGSAENEIRRTVRDGLRAPGLSDTARDALAGALEHCAQRAGP